MSAVGYVAWALVVALALGYAAYTRNLRYLERRAYYEALARGAVMAPPPRDPWDGPDPAAPPAVGQPAGPRRRLLAGMITAAVGAALLLGLLTLGVGPWLLGGLVPLFVGLALIFFWLLDRRP